MTDQAGFTPAGALMVRSGEAFALPLILQNGAGENQDLLGRSFVLSFRFSRASEPFLSVAGVLADDRFSVSFMVSAENATAIYEAGLSRALQGDITEVGGTFRHSFPVTVDEGSGVPVDEPISLPNFPVTELVAMPGATIVVERGAQGYGAERRLYDAGLIDEPTVAAMDERYALAGAPFADAAAASAVEAEAQAAAALADAERATLAADRAQLADDSVQAGANAYDDIVTGRSSVAVGELFRVFQPNGSIKTYRKTGTSSQEEKSEIESRTAAEQSRDVRAQRGGAIALLTDSTGINDITGSLPTAFANVVLVNDITIMFRAPANNTGAATLMGAPLRDADNVELTAGALKFARRYIARYSTFGGAHFELVTGGVMPADVKALEIAQTTALTDKAKRLADAVTALAQAAGSYTPMIPLIDRIGGWYDFTDRFSMWQDAAKTIPVRKSGDPIGFIEDKSGNGYHFAAESDARRPTWLADIHGTPGSRFSYGSSVDTSHYLTGVKKGLTRNRGRVTTFALVAYRGRGTQSFINHSVTGTATSTRYAVGVTGVSPSNRPILQTRWNDSTSVLAYSWKVGGEFRGYTYGDLMLLEADVNYAAGKQTLYTDGTNSVEGVAAIGSTSASRDTDETASYLSHPLNRLDGDIISIVEFVGDLSPREREGIYQYFQQIAPELEIGDLQEYDPHGPTPVVFFWFNYPNIFSLGSERYAVGGVTAGGSIMVGDYQFAGDDVAITNTVMFDKLEVDDHDVPTFQRLTDGNLIAVYCRHNYDGHMYVSKTTTPGDLTSWTTPVNIASQIITDPGHNVVRSYNFLFRHTGEGNRLYLIGREGDYTIATNPSNILTGEYWTINWSDDDGVTWTHGKRLWGPMRPYTRAYSNGVDRIDFLFNDSHPNADSTNRVHHCYLKDGAFRKSDGTLICSMEDLPPLGMNLDTDPTLIFNANTSTIGNAWVWDLTYDIATARPVGTFVTYRNGYTLNEYYQARWNGSTWSYHRVCEAGLPLTPTQVVYTGGIITDPQDINVVYCSRRVDASGDISPTGVYQIFRYVTADDGLTWTGTQLTFGDKPSFRMVIAPDSRKMFWVTGDYGDHYTQYVTHVEHMAID